jgi:hypothetical protein
MSFITDYAADKPRPRGKPGYRDLLAAPDQWRIRGDLKTFFGPQADTFLVTYEKMRSATGARRTSPRTWSWPVCLGSFTWFFYRKMYAAGATLIFLPMLFAYLFGTVGGAIWILFTVSAKGWYVHHGLARVFKADQLGLTGAERTDYLRRAGGVSLPAGILAGFVYACLLAIVVLGVIGRHHAGHG